MNMKIPHFKLELGLKIALISQLDHFEDFVWAKIMFWLYLSKKHTNRNQVTIKKMWLWI